MGFCSAIVALTLVVLPTVLGWSAIQLVSGDESFPRQPVEGAAQNDGAKYYFWNTVTGDVQWDDPGDVPYETQNGLLYWIGKDGQQQYRDEEAMQYTWVEGWSEQYERPFFYNQETQESVWDRPPDLAWRRIRVQTASEEL
ncbi:hypothetical protein COCOBI_14-2340 [Coccomyxa sp. Obi]|nr:hypothetical protein COCOBI_14-2340 [Coccomyxa sp. Obi]